jgi:Abnormal spindle-like microcephaly-assoc'd, ASPM-SPD-2-Hydin
MRLPQSIQRSLSLYTIHLLTIGMAIALLGLVPVRANAATPQLAYSPTDPRFGAVIVGQSDTLLVTLTNNGTTTVTVSEIIGSNPEFAYTSLSLPLTLVAGQSVNLTVTFTPTAAVFTNGTITFQSNASNPHFAIPVRGTGVNSEAATAIPAALSFGSVALGSSSTVPVVLKNDRPFKLTLSALQTKGNGFSTSGPTMPLTLAAGQSVTVNVTFTPQVAGATGGSVFVGGATLAIPLTGTGAAPGQLVIAPAPLNFGDVPVGTTATQPITMTASGGSLTVSSAASSSSQFVLDGASFPFTIPAGHSVSFNVGFTPQTSGTLSGALSFVSNASNPQALESLSGIGTVTTYSVNLYWNTSSDVAGYNVYRSTTPSGTYAKINSTLDPNTAYTDTTVVAGQTYYYAATSVSSNGQESTKSTPPVQAAVP